MAAAGVESERSARALGRTRVRRLFAGVGCRADVVPFPRCGRPCVQPTLAILLLLSLIRSRSAVPSPGEERHREGRELLRPARGSPAGSVSQTLRLRCAWHSGPHIMQITQRQARTGMSTTAESFCLAAVTRRQRIAYRGRSTRRQLVQHEKVTAPIQIPAPGPDRTRRAPCSVTTRTGMLARAAVPPCPSHKTTHAYQTGRVVHPPHTRPLIP